MSLPSASKLALAMTCPASATLPRVERITEAADKGTAVHAYLRDLTAMPKDAALERVPAAHRGRCEDINTLAFPEPGIERHAELALALDIETEEVRFIGHDVGRSYGERKTPTELFMSLDLAWMDEAGGHIIDWKTGRAPQGPASQNWQLKAQALAFARWKGLESVDASIARIPDDGEPFFDTALFDSFELSLIGSELRELSRRLSKPETLKPVMGEHCRYCDAFEACPAQGKLIARMGRTPEQVEKDIVDLLLTPETAAKAIERAKAVDTVLKRVWAAIYAYARNNGPVALGDGVYFGETQTKRKVLDAEVVRRVLTQMHGPEVADAATDFETSQAAIKRALASVQEASRKTGQKVPMKALLDSVLAAVADEGGLSFKVDKPIKTYRPGDAEEAE
jgi:hypothetical protein